jgi:hypothetical protein
LNHECETMVERNKSLDELTARLGNGFRATEGFTGWRCSGVPGIRPVITEFLLDMQYLAEQRLNMEELMDPQGLTKVEINNPQFNASRWTIVWAGQDLLLKVLHCLDFLRKCREVSDWYGPEFYFVANPLMLPFPLHPALKALGLQEKVTDQRMSKAFIRKGITNVELKTEFDHEYFLIKLKRSFEDITERWAFNWPELHDVREVEDAGVLFTCLLVLFVKCSESIEKSYVWEKSFISQISSSRGKVTFMLFMFATSNV